MIGRSTGLRAWIDELDRIDRSVYRAVAASSTPLLDRGMRRVSRAADHSKLSIGASVLLTAIGGPPGRRAAAFGLTSVAATSAFVNLIVKPIGRRHRPDRTSEAVPPARQVPMPTSRSFPSGHAAAAVAFASGTGRVLPAVGVPLHCLAALVAYSRVHTGVHYPGDVIAGALIGAVIADLTSGAIASSR